MQRPESWLEESEFDALVLGTGTLQCMLACALARAGKRVVHFDQNAFYGQQEAALTINDLVEYLTRPTISTPNEPFVFRQDATPFSNVSVYTAASAQEVLQKENRAYCIDLCPRPIYADEGIVRIFVRSGVHQYLEFKTLDKVCLSSPDGKLLQVPNSRNDVFGSDVVNLKEKRLLMKFIQTCSAADTDFLRDHGSEKFIDYLRAQGLTPNLESFLLYAITLCQTNQTSADAPDLLTVAEGIGRIKMYMVSASIYGSTPFLYPLYGLGEIAQAYSRATAVCGGIYLLKRTLKCLTRAEDGTVTGALSTDGQEFKAKIVITGCEYLNNCAVAKRYARAVCVLEGPVVAGGTVLSVIPPGTFGNPAAIHVLQLDSGQHVCPKGKVLLHVTTLATPGRTAEQDLSAVILALCSEPAAPLPTQDTSASSEPAQAAPAAAPPPGAPLRPSLLWRVYFNQNACSAPANLPAGFYVVPDVCALPGSSWASVLETAERMFAEMLPGAAFLAKTVGQPEESTSQQDAPGGLE